MREYPRNIVHKTGAFRESIHRLHCSPSSFNHLSCYLHRRFDFLLRGFDCSTSFSSQPVHQWDFVSTFIKGSKCEPDSNLFHKSIEPLCYQSDSFISAGSRETPFQMYIWNEPGSVSPSPLFVCRTFESCSFSKLKTFVSHRGWLFQRVTNPFASDFSTNGSKLTIHRNEELGIQLFYRLRILLECVDGGDLSIVISNLRISVEQGNGIKLWSACLVIFLLKYGTTNRITAKLAFDSSLSEMSRLKQPCVRDIRSVEHALLPRKNRCTPSSVREKRMKLPWIASIIWVEWNHIVQLQIITVNRWIRCSYRTLAGQSNKRIVKKYEPKWDQ
jgi:hypothetical protein